ncbi:MAG: anhydro-N-acetylmuramic acid kinase, partial [Rhodospirillales bacterium]|nr:anhydro-N-acetylmuramic acid kinase [Rhodospirillales bacterium]
LFGQPPRRWLVGGGGRRNPVLMKELSNALGVVAEPVEAAGWRGDAMEAEAFGFLAVAALRKLPLSFPSTTGVSQPLTGGRVHQPTNRTS